MYTHLEMKRLFALSARIILLFKTADRMMTPGKKLNIELNGEQRTEEKLYRWLVGKKVHGLPAEGDCNESS